MGSELGDAEDPREGSAPGRMGTEWLLENMTGQQD